MNTTNNYTVMLYRDFFKRFVDVIISLTGLLLLSPLFIGITILLFVSNRGRPFFFQKRPGRDEKIFRVIKFKTMNDRRDRNGELLPDQERLTNLGKFVRKTSLDEIPQLINVLLGDMSLIGPRPLLVEYLPLYDKTQKRRHQVRPGITGWAQVNGRNELSWEKKFELDIYYVDHISFLLDVKILIMTIFKVAKSEGVSSATHVTMEKFKGTHL